MGNPDAHKRLSDRSFGLLFGTILLGIAALAWFVAQRRWPTLAALGGSLLVLALLAPGFLMPLNRIWDAFARRLAPVTNSLFLGIFFYLVVAPMGLLMRLFSGDPLARRPQPDSPSYWTPVGRQLDAETLKDMF